MKLSYLQKPLLKPLVYTVLVGVLFGGVYSQLDEMLLVMNQEVVAEQARVESLYQEVHTTLDKIELVRVYNQRFQSFSADGVIGEQSRAHWIDKLMESINRNHVLHTKLTFSARSMLNESQLSFSTNPQLVHYETIDFEGAFQHEDQFLAFMDDIKRHVHALTLVEGCHFNLIAAGSDAVGKVLKFEPDVGNITAKCQFYFVEVSLNQQLPEASQ